MDLRDQLQSTLGSAYTLERELGGGGMSRVFVATDTALGRRVVIKVLPPETAAHVSIERFRREITLAAQLQQAHIVPLLSAGEAGGLPYYTMPFIEGESLRARLAREGELPIGDAVGVLKEVARALTASTSASSIPAASSSDSGVAPSSLRRPRVYVSWRRLCIPCSYSAHRSRSHGDGPLAASRRSCIGVRLVPRPCFRCPAVISRAGPFAFATYCPTAEDSTTSIGQLRESGARKPARTMARVNRSTSPA